jgi:hypothetical protein
MHAAASAVAIAQIARRGDAVHTLSDEQRPATNKPTHLRKKITRAE